MKEIDYFLQYLSACVLGDIIGYRNGDWEFNGKGPNGLYYQQGYQYTNEIVFEFLALGGINDIDISYWKMSDDSIMLLATAYALFSGFTSLDDFGKILSDNFVKSLDAIKNGAGGRRTIQSLETIKSGTSWKNIPYDPSAKGSGTAMRTSVIGVIYCGESQRDILTDLTIVACRITHYSVIGIMSGIMVAYFSAYGIEGVPYYQWLQKLIVDFESDIINGKFNSVFKKKEWRIEHSLFLGRLKKYQTWRFSHTRSPDGINHLMDRLMTNPSIRIKFLADNYTDSTTEHFFPGARGDEAPLLAFDALIQCQGSWEKLVVNSMLHSGDSDTIGTIAAGWYSLIYPGKIPKYINDHLDMEMIRKDAHEYIKNIIENIAVLPK